jgi:hypothetical protein
VECESPPVAVPCEDCATKVQHRGRQRTRCSFVSFAGTGWPSGRCTSWSRALCTAPFRPLGWGPGAGRPWGGQVRQVGPSNRSRRQYTLNRVALATTRATCAGGQRWTRDRFQRCPPAGGRGGYTCSAGGHSTLRTLTLHAHRPHSSASRAHTAGNQYIIIYQLSTRLGGDPAGKSAPLLRSSLRTGWNSCVNASRPAHARRCLRGRGAWCV